MIHPYLGFVYNPEDPDITGFGFLGDIDPLLKRSEDKVIIGIFGGSSAEIFAQYGKEKLIEELKKDARFKNKQIILLNVAIGSYKQPQQLMTLNYLLSLGGEFDIVINMDGFNEIVIPQLRNIPNEVNPFFPRRWDLKVVDKDILSPEIAILGDIIGLERKKRIINNAVYCGWLRFSNTAKFVVQRLDKKIGLEISEKRTALFNVSSGRPAVSRKAVSCGPGFEYKDEQELCEKLTKVWLDCSLIMNDICRGRGIEYFHFLQPCQYLPGSKKLHGLELENAFDENAAHRDMVVKGYPVLSERACELISSGVRFYDLSMVFAECEQPLYIDTFCHFGEKGSELIAEKAAEIILLSTGK